MYLGCLERELLVRNFDSSILFERDDDGKVAAYRLSAKVMISLMDGRLILITNPSAI